MIISSTKTPSLDSFNEELQLELAAQAPDTLIEKRRLDIVASNRRRSKLITVRTAQKKWDASPAPVTKQSSGICKLIDGKQVPEPISTAIALGILTSREIVLPPTISHRAVTGKPKEAAKLIRDRFSKLSEVSCESWYFKLDAIANPVLKVRIAKLVWWDILSRNQRQHSVIQEEMVNVEGVPVGNFSQETIAFELYKLGYPASIAMSKAAAAVGK